MTISIGRRGVNKKEKGEPGAVCQHAARPSFARSIPSLVAERCAVQTARLA